MDIQKHGIEGIGIFIHCSISNGFLCCIHLIFIIVCFIHAVFCSA